MSDVLLSFFATPGGPKAAIAQPLDLFKTPVIRKTGGMSACKEMVVDSFGTSRCKESDAARFGTWIEQFRNTGTGRLLPKYLDHFSIKPTPGMRIALAGFSAGGAAVRKLLQHPADREAIDSVIGVDDFHLQREPSGRGNNLQEQGMLQFGTSALDASHLLVLLHTQVVPVNFNQILSTKESVAQVMGDLANIAPVAKLATQPWDPEALKKFPAPAPVTIPGQSGDIPRTFTDLGLTATNIGNVFAVSMPGATPGFHIAAAELAQGVLFRTFLAPRWNEGLGCVVAVAGLNRRALR